MKETHQGRINSVYQWKLQSNISEEIQMESLREE